MKADTIKAALSTTAMKTPRNDMALSSSIISARPGASRSQGAERLRCLASGSAHCIRNLATLETQGLEKLNVTHLQRLAKSRIRLHTFHIENTGGATHQGLAAWFPAMAGIQHNPFLGGDIEEVQDLRFRISRLCAPDSGATRFSISSFDTI